MIVEQNGRMVRIETNVYAGEKTYIAVLNVGGTPLTSKTFKSEAGALRWAHKKVMR